jgi:predicted nucleotidyltransferase
MLTDLITSKLRAKVLARLFSHPDERYYVRQLQSLLGEDLANLSRELARLAASGILDCSTEGRQKYYQANRRSPIFEELRGLVLKTAGLADVIRAALSRISPKVRVAFVYGSQASGEVKATSDVDVLVVGNATFAEVVSALSGAQDVVGREINPTVFPPDEFQGKIAAGDHFLTTVLLGPRIFLIGDERDLAGLGGAPLDHPAQDEPPGDR